MSMLHIFKHLYFASEPRRYFSILATVHLSVSAFIFTRSYLKIFAGQLFAAFVSWSFLALRFRRLLYSVSPL